MKKAAVALWGFFLAAGICFADPAEGYWLSTDEKTGLDTAGWLIYQEGNKLYGKIIFVTAYPQDVKAEKCRESYRGFPVPGNVANMPVVGTPWIFGLSMHRPGEWRGGNIINPEDGSMYGCRIIYHAPDGGRYQVETLEVRGTIGPLGRSQYWRRLTREWLRERGY
ncbi:MAG: DUF2147 domain-containing protein [Spirochaetaceae bacterium]|jgi:uncharacterized protein (DUF2147 family)|nr:DUF2147 domain-containing protein [Spirochaetaceae bacterium]